ncbi:MULTISPECIES: radical SAM family heme chaperone HemW [unclassified Synechocystis]|uniref:radical SAM family heme chaperone HemW n=1 Tax=unclassified Synechocystis TaxID=2640012 RepID=UPI00040A2C05|nr:MULTISPECIES: radical SAM family heme chaperone HemW [unclassified Synechocystis]AIE74309.1 putative radical SAM family enzyme in heat shock gene cluster, similarity with CPO of BS HemN-type [Synechocystis sp. PCC 6714]MCT0254905.1 radical SAM family heme chaperone HemW [Synechocystis sp. CS-94]
MPTAAYIHIPFCRQRCFYCDFPIAVTGFQSLNMDGWVGEYVAAVCREIAGQQHQEAPLKTVFFGGGTPSLLPIAGLEKILAVIDKHLGIATEAEISIEIDPGTFDQRQLQAYKNLGINRFSLGVQAFQDKLLTLCGRHHRRRDIDQALTAIAQENIKNWSLDLITGLPEQTAADWHSSLTLALAAGPKHISCYDLVLEPQTVFDKWQQWGKLAVPPSECSADFYRHGQQVLTQAGFQHYEISNYGRPDYQCRHNQIYWRNLPYYGFGMGATSYIDSKRFGRPRTRNDYYQWLESWLNQGCPTPGETVSPLENLLESLMLGLRLTAGVTWGQLPATSAGTKQIILNTLKSFGDRHWLEFYGEDNQILAPNWATTETVQRFCFTDPEGILYSNQILSALFAALEEDY